MLKVRVDDSSVIKSVYVYYKLMPAQYEWLRMEMRPTEDGSYGAAVPLTPEFSTTSKQWMKATMPQTILIFSSRRHASRLTVGRRSRIQAGGDLGVQDWLGLTDATPPSTAGRQFLHYVVVLGPAFSVNAGVPRAASRRLLNIPPNPHCRCSISLSPAAENLWFDLRN